jgi:MFS family permease
LTRASAVIIGFAVLVGAFALLVAVPGAVWVAVSASLAGVGLALTLPILTTATTEMFGIERAGVAVSLNLAVGQVASTISGVLLGYIQAAGGAARPAAVSLLTQDDNGGSCHDAGPCR